uniref:Uncharacterized protein n=1 Tax=Trichobilharzia regenti TaxID=157069 RepID=A0AA85IXE9_TRIRE|nr:unnamed protein product [Trichobilharzia regenti]
MLRNIWWTLSASIFLYILCLPTSEAGFLWWLYCLFFSDSAFCSAEGIVQTVLNATSNLGGGLQLPVSHYDYLSKCPCFTVTKQRFSRTLT